MFPIILALGVSSASANQVIDTVKPGVVSHFVIARPAGAPNFGQANRLARGIVNALVNSTSPSASSTSWIGYTGPYPHHAA